MGGRVGGIINEACLVDVGFIQKRVWCGKMK